MIPSEIPTPLISLTLETLCSELVSGRAISIGDAEGVFQFNSIETRAVFNWYLNNRPKWTKRISKDDIEIIVDELGKEPPEFPALEKPAISGEIKTIHLKSVKTHRFAGIQRYGKLDHAPDEFYYEFDKPLTLIEGSNGSGKTSLLSAICWCLTGQVYRTHRKPENVEQSVPVEVVSDTEEPGDNKTLFDMSAITPLPSSEILKSLEGKPLPLDTWVELSFADENGDDVGSIRRSVKRSPRGKRINVTEPDFTQLGLDPIAREVGTKMPGLIPYIQLESASDLGKAVATLTGIMPLQNLADHAERVKNKLEKELPKEREKEINSLDKDFLEVREELSNLFNEHSAIRPDIPIPKPGPETTVEEVLTNLEGYFEESQANMLIKCKKVLGDSFDPSDKSTRDELAKNVGPALGLIDAEEVAKLGSASRLYNLGQLKADEISQAVTLIEKLITEANQIAELSKQPDHANRLRLYAKVAGWLKDQPEGSLELRNCPVCLDDLAEKLDPVTNKSIREHIREYLDKEADFLEKTIQVWEKSALAILSSSVSGQLQLELKQELPEHPRTLISTALTAELFKSDRFSGSLAPLKNAVRKMCEEVLGELPSFEEPVNVTLPECFTGGSNSINQAITRIIRAIAFARWRQENANSCRQVFEKVIGKSSSEGQNGDYSGIPVEKLPLSKRLDELDALVKSTIPLREASSKVKTMKSKINNRRKKEKRINDYKRASKAIEPLTGLSELVEKQVSYLMEKLQKETIELKNSFYTSAYSGAPEICKTDVGTDGNIMIDAACRGAKAPAHHISNTSDLRATLLAFLIAFWKHLLETRGGLSLLLLDDLQESFDKHNLERVANCIPSLIEFGGRIIVTTKSDRFSNNIVTACSQRFDTGQIDRRLLHPIGEVRWCAELGVFVEDLDIKRNDFEDLANENKHKPARDYIKDLRIYIERRLLDILDVSGVSLSDKPTLSELINAVRTARKAGKDMFSSEAFLKLVSNSALKDGSEFLKLMNKSHHGKESEIQFNEVKAVRDECIRVRKLVDAAHNDYWLWKRRDFRKPPDLKPEVPHFTEPQIIKAPIIEDLAAFTVSTEPGETAGIEEYLDGSFLSNRAIYMINSHNFGFAGKINCRVIVDLSSGTAVDNDLVIALHKEKVYARRLLMCETNPQFVTLGSEAENPSKRPPSLSLPREEVRLLRVVGILFDDKPVYPRPSEEATGISGCDLIGQIEIAFRVKGESALPLALPGQVILGGKQLKPTQISEMAGHFLAVSTEDGSVFKRVGKFVPDAPHLLQLESIGGLGESMLVRMEEIAEDKYTSLPLIVSARAVLGVIYKH